MAKKPYSVLAGTIISVFLALGLGDSLPVLDHNQENHPNEDQSPEKEESNG